MAYVVIGVGQAGSAIVDEMFANKYLGMFAQGVAINSTMKDLMNLKHIPQSNWLGISAKDGLISGKTEGFEQQVVGGFGKDPRRAAEIMDRNFDKLVLFLERVFKSPMDRAAPVSKNKKKVSMEDEVDRLTTNAMNAGSESAQWIAMDEEGKQVVTDLPEQDEYGNLGQGHVPFALVVLGLGGGTGSGASPTLLRAIRRMSQVDTTVIVVGILPATHEHGVDEDGGASGRGAFRQAWNTRWALDELEKVADGIILVDNERLSFSKNVEALFPQYNHYIATSLTDLIGGALLEGIDMKQYGDVSLPVIDIQDIVSAISFSNSDGGRTPGYAALGRAVELTHRFPGYVLPLLGRREVDPVALLKLALMKRSVAGSMPENARKNLAQVRIPPWFLKSADKFPSTGRIEEELGRMSDLGETHFGITLTKRRIVSITTLMTYRREDIDRLATIERMAERYEDRNLLEAI